MSYEKIVKINFTVTWLHRSTILVLCSFCVYFLQGIHHDFKTMQKDVADSKIEIATAKADISNIKVSITDLKSLKP